MKFENSIDVLEDKMDMWKRALARLRRTDRKNKIKKEYLTHKNIIKEFQQAIKILKQQ